MARRFILSPEHFEQFVSPPLSLNGALMWRPEWLIEDLVIKKGVTFIGGAPKVGKSLLRSHLLVCAIAGRPAIGRFHVEKAQKGLLLAGEEALEIEEARLRKAAKSLGIEEKELPIQIMTQQGFFFDDGESYSNFVEWTVDNDFDLVVVDPLVRWHRANENVTAEMSPVLGNLRTLMHRGVSVIIVHHTSKPHADRPEMSLGFEMRGTGDFSAALDHYISLNNVRGANKAQKKLKFQSRFGQFDDVEVELFVGDEELNWSVFKNAKERLKEVRQIFSNGRYMGAKELGKAINRGESETRSALEKLKTEGLTEQGPKGWTWIGAPNDGTKT